MSKVDPSPAAHLDCAEAARFLNMSPRTLEKYRVIGGGPRFRKFGRRVMYAVSDLEEWSNDRVCESTSDEAYFKASMRRRSARA